MRSTQTNRQVRVFDLSEPSRGFLTEAASAAIQATSKLAILCALLLILILARPAQGQVLTVLHNFTGPDGLHPESSLISDGSGNLFGNTLEGGQGCPTNIYGCGTVFEISPNGSGGWDETVLHSFSGPPDAANPFRAPLIFDQSGNLYGTTEFAGPGPGGGTVFELSPAGAGWAETILYTFTSQADGGHPAAGLVRDVTGNLYGTTSEYEEPGNAFELSPSGSGWTLQVIYNAPTWSGLTMDATGNLYGTTDSTVFELSPDGIGGWNPTVVHTFTGPPGDGIGALGNVVLDQAGNIYGTTYQGGSANNGTVYKLSPAGNGEWTEQILYSLKGGKDGANPVAGVALDAAGNIYGTTTLGGGKGKGQGTVFELVALGNSTYQHVVLWSFSGTDGQNPYSIPLLDGAGHLYGTAGSGGTSNAGVVFELTLPAVTTTTLSSSENPSTYEQAVTFTAVVSSAKGTAPDGDTVTFQQGKTTLATRTLSGGLAAFTTATLPVGTHAVTAVYKGDPYFLGSTSSAVKQVVKAVLTSTALSSSPDPSTYGQAVTFTASVTSSQGVPPEGETVTFMKGTTTLGTGSLNGGLATLTNSALPVGTNWIRAVYRGDPDFRASASNSVKQVVK